MEFAKRREQLLKELKKEKAVALIPSAKVWSYEYGGDISWRQSSLFHYLTGWDEPGALLLFAPFSKTPFQIFAAAVDPDHVLWNGPMTSPGDLRQLLGADFSAPIAPQENWLKILERELHGMSALYYRLGIEPKRDESVIESCVRIRRPLVRGGGMIAIRDPQEIVGEMRLFKSKEEILSMVKAIEITGEGFVGVMKAMKSNIGEWEIEAHFTHTCQILGAKRLAYQPIVGSGPNACVLHYRKNNRKAKEGEWVLIDAGAEWGYYASDITRVIPVNGTFNPIQRQVYEGVLSVQKEVIKKIRPGKTFQSIHEEAVEGIVEVLRQLRVLKGRTQTLIKEKSYRAYYPHGTSHWLGMDVHDVGAYHDIPSGNSRRLEPGMVVTVEPGLYFSKGPASLRGLGCRIEDDILITEKGSEVLSKRIPKEVEEIEAICAS